MSKIVFEDQSTALSTIQGIWYNGSERITILSDGTFTQSEWIKGEYLQMASGYLTYDTGSYDFYGQETWSRNGEPEQFSFWLDGTTPPTAGSVVIHTLEDDPFTLTAQQPTIPFTTPGLYETFNGTTLNTALWDSWNWDTNETSYIIQDNALQATVGPESERNSAGMSLTMSAGYQACVMTVFPTTVQGNTWFSLGTDLGSQPDGRGFSVSLGFSGYNNWYQIQANANQEVSEEQWDGVWHFSEPLPPDTATKVAYQLGMEVDADARVVRFYVDEEPFATYTLPDDITLDPYHDFQFYLGSNTGARFDIRDVWVGDTLQEAMGRISSAESCTLASNQVDLTLTGTQAINGIGNGRANRLIGNGANNRLEGRSGNDYLDGRGGADVLIGGSGNDLYVVNTVNDQVQELTGNGIDEVRASCSWSLGENLEQLTLTGSSAIHGTGNALHNIITGNSANNTLDGGTGIDLLIGRGGNDTYIVNSMDDQIQEAPNSGTDLVRSSVSWTLGNDLEQLTLTGTRAIQGTGNGLDNLLTGNGAANTLNGSAGRDTLNGMAGDDVLIGGSGSDRLTGGTGADRFKYSQPSHGGDTITDFSASSGDRLEFVSANFGRLTVGPLASSRLVSNSSGKATTTGQRFIFNTSTRVLSYDADGSTGTVAPVVVATLNVSSLSASAILISS
ncbi:MAG: calcium-binding protein [Magnetococcales bacterium]|nr:calcium-binding protein [Magnetococcales bacterium]NGZ07231.1 calcium-binding protein [Magnetococcales bacterium]